MTAARLGEVTGVSESTVVRFAADLGYRGYPGMKKALQEIVRNRLTSVERIEAAESTMDGHAARGYQQSAGHARRGRSGQL